MPLYILKLKGNETLNIAIISLGCPKNQVDADVMCHALITAGHTTTADLSEADVIIVNTCGFIESAKAEAIENILDACSYKEQNRNLKVVVTGCLAERYQKQIREEIPEVDAVVGIGSNKALPAILERLSGPGAGPQEYYGPKTDLPLGGARVISTPAHYAYLKIAEGCNNRCHYCAIPLIRGPLRSRPMDDCIAEARWLASEGVKELIVVAQDPTAYGSDWGKNSICELLDELNKIDGIQWIRVMYAYPERITDEFIEAMRRNKKVVLLSGSAHSA
ncbi:ribosomal protein S12 methylthiotransferase RimO, partial [gut metagenome]